MSVEKKMNLRRDFQMKKILILLMISILLCGCGKTQLPDDACDFLIQAEWEGNDAQCVNAIRFQKDKSFSNWCFCGSPVGDGDLVEEFRYRASDKTWCLSRCRCRAVAGRVLSC